jgi:hypothetical protein
MIRDYLSFEEDGSMGDTLLRIRAQEYSEIARIPPAYVVPTIEKLAFECYRYFYEKARTAEPN